MFVTVTGTRGVLFGIEKIDELVGARIGSALYRAGAIVAGRAKIIITEKRHVITGNLRRSIQTTQPKRDIGGDISVQVGSDVDYAIHVEFLSDGGYLYQALREEKDTVINYVRGELRVIL